MRNTKNCTNLKSQKRAITPKIGSLKVITLAQRNWSLKSSKIIHPTSEVDLLCKLHFINTLIILSNTKVFNLIR